MKKEKIKNPYINVSWLIYIVMLVIGCLIAKLMMDYLGVYMEQSLFIIFDIGILAYGFITSVAFYNLGKLIFAKIAGFDIVYFNLWLIGFTKVDNKLKVYFGGREGFSCKVAITPKRDNANYKLALWGGSIALLLVAGVTYGLTFGLNANGIIRFFFGFSGIFYLFAFIAYMIPCKTDKLNDGFTLYLIDRYECKDVYFRNLRNVDALYNKDKELEYFDYSDSLDPLRMEGKIYNYYYLLEKNKMDLADKLASEMAENNKYFIDDEFIQTALIANIYRLCINNKIEELEDYYWKLDNSSRRLFNNKNSLESLKTAIYVAGFIDSNKIELDDCINNINKVEKKYHYIRRIELEDKLINEAIEAVYNSKPEWKELNDKN